MKSNKQMKARTRSKLKLSCLAQIVIGGAAFAMLSACGNGENVLQDDPGSTQYLPGQERPA